MPSLHRSKKGRCAKTVSFLVCFVFLTNIVLPSTGFAQMLQLPAPGTMVPLSTSYQPAIITGIQIHPNNPFEFDFIVNSGDDGLEGQAFKSESEKMIRYFLASLTTPEEDLWVNLSPYEKDRIVADDFGKTEMGRDMLAQDYLLKQITASLIYPENDLGRKFWEKIYKKAYETFGTTEIPINTFNKVWIMPDEVAVYEHDNMVFVAESSLKVMLEEDYLALQENQGRKDIATNQIEKSEIEKTSAVSSAIVREIVIPELEKEVNFGRNFAPLRQIYHSLILAAWFKQAAKTSLLGQAYVDKNRTKGIDLVSEQEGKEVIYQKYLEAYKQGAYNYIKAEYDPYTNKNLPRKYFSGGIKFYWNNFSEKIKKITNAAFATLEQRKNIVRKKRNNFKEKVVFTGPTRVVGAESLPPDHFKKIIKTRNGQNYSPSAEAIKAFKISYKKSSRIPLRKSSRIPLSIGRRERTYQTPSAIKEALLRFQNQGVPVFHESNLAPVDIAAIREKRESQKVSLTSYILEAGGKVAVFSRSSSGLRVKEIIEKDGSEILQHIADAYPKVLPRKVVATFDDGETLDFSFGNAKDGIEDVWPELDGSDDIKEITVFFSGYSSQFVKIRPLSEDNNKWQVVQISGLKTSSSVVKKVETLVREFMNQDISLELKPNYDFSIEAKPFIREVNGKKQKGVLVKVIQSNKEKSPDLIAAVQSNLLTLASKFKGSEVMPVATEDEYSLALWVSSSSITIPSFADNVPAKEVYSAAKNAFKGHLTIEKVYGENNEGLDSKDWPSALQGFGVKTKEEGLIGFLKKDGFWSLARRGSADTEEIEMEKPAAYQSIDDLRKFLLDLTRSKENSARFSNESEKNLRKTIKDVFDITVDYHYVIIKDAEGLEQIFKPQSGEYIQVVDHEDIVEEDFNSILRPDGTIHLLRKDFEDEEIDAVHAHVITLQGKGKVIVFYAKASSTAKNKILNIDYPTAKRNLDKLIRLINENGINLAEIIEIAKNDPIAFNAVPRESFQMLKKEDVITEEALFKITDALIRAFSARKRYDAKGNLVTNRIEPVSYVHEKVIPINIHARSLAKKLYTKHKDTGIKRGYLAFSLNQIMRIFEDDPGLARIAINIQAAKGYAKSNVGENNPLDFFYKLAGYSEPGNLESYDPTKDSFRYVNEQNKLLGIDVETLCYLSNVWGYTNDKGEKEEISIEDDIIPMIETMHKKAGIKVFALSDTTGEATAQETSKAIRKIFKHFRKEIERGEIRFTYHGHTDSEQGIVNVLAAIVAGIREIDVSLLNQGGSPKAAHQVGNIPMEDILSFFEAIGIDTGVDLDIVIDEARDEVGKNINPAYFKDRYSLGFAELNKEEQEKLAQYARVVRKGQLDLTDVDIGDNVIIESDFKGKFKLNPPFVLSKEDEAFLNESQSLSLPTKKRPLPFYLGRDGNYKVSDAVIYVDEKGGVYTQSYDDWVEQGKKPFRTLRKRAVDWNNPDKEKIKENKRKVVQGLVALINSLEFASARLDVSWTNASLSDDGKFSGELLPVFAKDYEGENATKILEKVFGEPVTLKELYSGAETSFEGGYREALLKAYQVKAHREALLKAQEKVRIKISSAAMARQMIEKIEDPLIQVRIKKGVDRIGQLFVNKRKHTVSLNILTLCRNKISILWDLYFEEKSERAALPEEELEARDFIEIEASGGQGLYRITKDNFYIVMAELLDAAPLYARELYRQIALQSESDDLIKHVWQAARAQIANLDDPLISYSNYSLLEKKSFEVPEYVWGLLEENEELEWIIGNYSRGPASMSSEIPTRILFREDGNDRKVFHEINAPFLFVLVMLSEVSQKKKGRRFAHALLRETVVSSSVETSEKKAVENHPQWQVQAEKSFEEGAENLVGTRVIIYQEINGVEKIYKKYNIKRRAAEPSGFTAAMFAYELSKESSVDLDTIVRIVAGFNQEEKNSSAATRTGGIDLTGIYKDLNIKIDGEGVPLPLEMQNLEQIQIDGLVPVIINIMPMPQLPQLLGFQNIEERDDGSETAEILADEPKELSLLK
ncbi:MAG: hypothetical protein P9M07_04425 [Candidatus Aceula meridiana]|nr:hypothetical protein [Candidatus Aceula meridiana]